MSLTNPKDVVTEQRLKDFYDEIFPYLGGAADAGFTPVGTVIAVMGNSAPLHYLACNGQVVNIADYPELANYFLQQFGSKNYFGGNGTTTFAVCDLRGEFIRMTGTNSHANQGSGAAVGVHQDATQLPRIEAEANSRIFASTSSSGVNGYSNADKEVGNSNTNRSINVSGSGSDWSGINTDITTRPTNTSVLFCIATKNIYLNPSLDYSTDEKVVGSWIDGKPLYQKTAVISIGDTWVNAHQVFNANEVAHLIKWYGSFIRSDGRMQIIPYAPDTAAHYDDYNRTGYLNNFDGKMYFQFGNVAQPTNTTIYVTFQYTKTTDA